MLSIGIHLLILQSFCKSLLFFLVVFYTIGSLGPRPKTNPSVDEVWGRDYTIGCSGI